MLNIRSIFRARFTNSLCQHKPFLPLKKYCQDLLKMRQWRIGAEKAWTVIFAPDLIEYAFVVISLSDAKLVKLLIFAPLFNAQKKHVLNYFAPVS